LPRINGFEVLGGYWRFENSGAAVTARGEDVDHRGLEIRAVIIFKPCPRELVACCVRSCGAQCPESGDEAPEILASAMLNLILRLERVSGRQPG
jgi:hypothetical protein